MNASMRSSGVSCHLVPVYTRMGGMVNRPSLVAWTYLLLMPLYATAPVARRRAVTVGLVLCALLPWIGFFR